MAPNTYLRKVLYNGKNNATEFLLEFELMKCRIPWHKINWKTNMKFFIMKKLAASITVLVQSIIRGVQKKLNKFEINLFYTPCKS